MRIDNRMTRDPERVTPQDSLAVAKALMDAGGFRRLPVVEAGKLVGIVTNCDVRSHATAVEKTKVGDAMTRNPIAVTPRTTVEEAARLLLRYRIGGLPVLDHGELVGIITTTDVLKAFLDVVRASQEMLSGR